MATPKQVDIQEIFQGLQKQMEVGLSFDRRVLTHPVTKGDASELEWIKMLREYLPERYKVDKAHVIDHKGSVSDQIDLVIFDRHYSPFILRRNSAKYIPAESVYAVIEIKPSLTPANVRYSSNKAFSVRRLKRTSAKIVQADGRDFTPKQPPKILAGILTLAGEYTEGIEGQLQQLDEDHCLNFGCSLAGTFFAITGFHPWLPNVPPYKFVNVNGSENSLILFFLNLLAELQKMGTVPAIDIEKYAASIK